MKILRNSEDLARELAFLARQLKEEILQIYQQEDDNGHVLRHLESFRQILIKTLTIDQCSDMIVQTLCYCLFIAKCRDVTQPLLRDQMATYWANLPPWLAPVFKELTCELDQRFGALIDPVVTVLNHVDQVTLTAELGHRAGLEDPVMYFYETFLAHYDAKLREVCGVYYTPEPVISYIVRSVDWVLQEKFGLTQGLADNSSVPNLTGLEVVHKVQILDPATGTGLFLVAVLAHIYERFRQTPERWSEYVPKHLLPRIQGFELLMAPYTVAHLKLSLQLQATGYQFQGEEPLQVFLTNPLEEAQERSAATPFARWLASRTNITKLTKQESPIMVIIGNPPYSGHSTNTGKWINNLLHGIGDQANYFEVDGQPLKERNPKWLNDDYVKFIRFAQWRIEQTGYGVLGFVTNHGYLDNPTFRGMRQALLQAFDEIYILDLHGNGKKKEKTPEGGVDQNVFDIQQGVAIGIFLKYLPSKDLSGLATVVKPQSPKDLTGLQYLSGLAKVYHAHLYGDRTFKYEYLREQEIKTTAWTELQPRSPFYLFIPQQTDLLAEYEQGWKITEMMPVNGVGIITARDEFVIDFEKEKLLDRIESFRKSRLPDEQLHSTFDIRFNLNWQIRKAWQLLQEVTKIDFPHHCFKVLYRPFDERFIYYHDAVVDRMVRRIMQHLLAGENLGLMTIRRSRSSNDWKEVFVSKYVVAGATSISALDINYCFPLYLYATNKQSLFGSETQDTMRKPNFADEFIQDLETRLKLQWRPEGHGDFQKTISALDVFNYIYAVFHSATYRQRYVAFLKLDFPRVPLTRDPLLFKQLAELGKQLVNIHLREAELESACRFPIQGSNLVEKLTYREERVYINKTQYFDPVTPEKWAFHIGGYQVCEKWLKDRKGRVLSAEDCFRYLYILAAVEKTLELMRKIDETIPGFPLC